MNSALDVLRSSIKPENTYIEFEFLDRKARIYVSDFGRIMVEQNYNESQLAIKCRTQYQSRKFDRQTWIDQRRKDAQAEVDLLKGKKPTKEINKLIDDKNKTLSLLETNAPDSFAEYAKRIESQFELYKAVIPFMKDESGELVFKPEEIEDAIKLIETQFDLRSSINLAFNELVERSAKGRSLIKNS